MRLFYAVPLIFLVGCKAVHEVSMPPLPPKTVPSKRAVSSLPAPAPKKVVIVWENSKTFAGGERYLETVIVGSENLRDWREVAVLPFRLKGEWTNNLASPNMVFRVGNRLKR